MSSRQEFESQKSVLQDISKRLGELTRKEIPRLYAGDIAEFRKESGELLRELPGLDNQIYLHIIGVPKAFKTTYLLDLFRSDTLNRLLEVPPSFYGEHTGCPCLINAVNTAFSIEQWSLQPGGDPPVHITEEEFKQLYQVRPGKEGSGYLLKINLPKKELPDDAPGFPIIEYPGIEISNEAKPEQKELHEAFQNDMMQAMRRFPGLVVACFKTNLRIPNGHPITEYKDFLSQYSDLRPPLVLSLHGLEAVTGFCGNNDVMGDIQKYFPQYASFDTIIQLVNPNNLNYPVKFTEAGPHVKEWIKQLSRYEDIDQVRQEIEKDGGIKFSLELLSKLTQQEGIRDIIDRIYLTPWLERAKKSVVWGRKLTKNLESYDEIQVVKNKLREQISRNEYDTIDILYEKRQRERPAFANTEEYQEKMKAFWIGLVISYFRQFSVGMGESALNSSPEDKPSQKCQEIAREVVEGLLRKVNGNRPAWQFRFVEDDPSADYIMLNLLRFHLGALVMRGDDRIYKGFVEC